MELPQPENPEWDDLLAMQARRRNASRPPADSELTARVFGISLLIEVGLLGVLVLFYFLGEIGRDRLWALLFGWLFYLMRVGPQTNPDPWAVVSGILCFSSVTVGTHFFARWLWGHSWPWKRTGQLIGLVVLMFLGGLASTGLIQQTLWLIRTPEPWIQKHYQHKLGSTVE